MKAPFLRLDDALVQAKAMLTHQGLAMSVEAEEHARAIAAGALSVDEAYRRALTRARRSGVGGA